MTDQPPDPSEQAPKSAAPATGWQTWGQKILHFVGRLCLWLLIAAVVAAILGLFGFDVGGWLRTIWDNIREVSPGAIAVALVFVTIGKLLSSVPLTAALRASYPDTDIRYKVILASNQAGSLINTFAPAQAGSVAKLGIMRLAIPGSTIGTIVAVSALTSLVFGVISIVTFVILIGFQRPVVSESTSQDRSIVAFVQDHPAITVAAIALIVLGAIILYRRHRSKLTKLKDQLLLGGAILKTPRQFVLSVILPSLLSYLTRYVQTAIFMNAFGIPVTVQSLFLVIAGRQFSGLIAVTPGGFGTKQAVDVIALRRYASSDIVTSFSVAQDAITKAWNVIFAIIAMSWGFGFTGARSIWADREKYVAAGSETTPDVDPAGQESDREDAVP